MSWWDIFRPKPKPQPPIPPARYTVRVEVFDGDPSRDEKVPGARVVVGSMQAVADDAGNAHITNMLAGGYPVFVEADGFLDLDTVAVVPGPAVLVSLERDIPPLVNLTTDRQIFRQNGQPWRYKGVTAFRLLDRFASGDDIMPFLDAYAGFNVLRVFGYTPVKDWGVNAWNWPRTDDLFAFIEFVGARGWYVELVMLTDGDPAMAAIAERILQALAPKQYPNLLIEWANEPQTNGKAIDTSKGRAALDASGYLYASGDYEDSDRWFGHYYTCHTQRTRDWTRRAHDLYDFYIGEGPDKKTHPHHVPCLGDEPGKVQDVGAVISEWLAYFGACALLGGGATFHSESGKLASLPTPAERLCIAAALDALNAFPADAPFGSYRRIVEPGNEKGGPTETSRTYVVGNYMVRCQQRGTAAPEPGWTALDTEGVLWRR